MPLCAVKVTFETFFAVLKGLPLHTLQFILTAFWLITDHLKEDAEKHKSWPSISMLIIKT